MAPYTSSAQLALFFKDLMINVCFGSVALLGFEVIDQAITSFDLEKETFSFVDRADAGLDLKDVREKIIEAGCFY